MYTADTNAIIYYLGNDPSVSVFFDRLLKTQTVVYISSITEIELLSYTEISFDQIQQIENLLATVPIVPVDSKIARISAFVRRTSKLKLADSIIAATALFTRTTLVTRNVRDFRKVPNLKLLQI